MPTFIDESGDTGWLPGALPYFRLAGVWLPTFDAIEIFRESIRHVRQILNVGAGFEFKFSRTNAAQRSAFFSAIIEHEFRFAACGYDKRELVQGSLDTQGFHWGCAVALATDLKATYVKAEAEKSQSLRKPAALNELVVVDDNQDRKFLAEIKRTFRGLASAVCPGGKLVGKVKFRDSGPDEMLQLVDMILGATGAKFDGNDAWFDLISSKCVGLTCFRK
jgi:hypothetical protein